MLYVNMPLAPEAGANLIVARAVRNAFMMDVAPTEPSIDAWVDHCSKHCRSIGYAYDTVSKKLKGTPVGGNKDAKTYKTLSPSLNIPAAYRLVYENHRSGTHTSSSASYVSTPNLTSLVGIPRTKTQFYNVMLSVHDRRSDQGVAGKYDESYLYTAFERAGNYYDPKWEFGQFFMLSATDGGKVTNTALYIEQDEPDFSIARYQTYTSGYKNYNYWTWEYRVASYAVVYENNPVSYRNEVPLQAQILANVTGSGNVPMVVQSNGAYSLCSKTWDGTGYPITQFDQYNSFEASGYINSMSGLRNSSRTYGRLYSPAAGHPDDPALKCKYAVASYQFGDLKRLAVLERDVDFTTTDTNTLSETELVITNPNAFSLYTGEMVMSLGGKGVVKEGTNA